MLFARNKNITRIKKRDGRLIFLTIVFFLFGGCIIFRLFDLQVLRYDYYSSVAARKHEMSKDIIPARGLIYVREEKDLYPLVSNKNYTLVYVDPRKITDISKTIDGLASSLGLREDEWKNLIPKLNNKSDPYEPIKSKVVDDDVNKLKVLNLPGIYFTSENYRFYTEKDFSGQILGFVGYSGEGKIGLYGLEGYFNNELTGQPGILKSVKDATGQPVTIGDRISKKPINGDDLVLTIDRTVQVTVCEKLKKAVQDYEATGGTVIIMNPKTGAIIAMCSQPNFDPEEYNKIEDINIYNNPALVDAYEPGSIFKAITMSIGIDTDKITPQTTYTDTGEIKIIGQKSIKNSDLKAHGEQTMIQVLEKSLNTGAVFVAEKVGKEKYRQYVKDFGFGQLTGITLNSEAVGNISSLYKKGEIYLMTGSFGQGITVTPIQFITAFSAIANNGKLMKPYIIDEIISPSGLKMKTQPEVIRQVITSRTASLVSGMLVSSVENGWAKNARLNGYYVAGKTGTAQIPKSGGYSDKTMHSFVGYFPADDPKFSILVRLDEPAKINFADSTAAPLFSQIADFLVKYYHIPPARKIQ